MILYKITKGGVEKKHLTDEQYEIFDWYNLSEKHVDWSIVDENNPATWFGIEPDCDTIIVMHPTRDIPEDECFSVFEQVIIFLIRHAQKFHN